MSQVKDTWGDIAEINGRPELGDDGNGILFIETRYTPEGDDEPIVLGFEFAEAVDFAETVINEIKSMLPADKRAEIDALTPANLFGATVDDERHGWNQDAIAAAIEYSRTARFSYEKQSGPGGIIERRTLQPSELCYTRLGEPFVVGYDPDREDVRAFRLDRIIGHVEVF